MKRFCEQKIEIFDYLDSIDVQAFRMGVLKSMVLFSKLKKMVPQTIEEAYEEAHKFFNLERELQLIKKCVTLEAPSSEKEKREMRPKKVKAMVKVLLDNL